MDLQLYIKDIESGDYVQLDLFQDEKVELNLNVKNINDISKIISDFSQPFTIPTTPTNNRLFQYWYNADVDGNFNANIRVDAYIEINSLPFRYGSLQLDSCKLKRLMPYSYAVTFFGAGVNLSDKFGDDLLNVLDLSEFDHDYNQTAVLNAIQGDTINNGDVYYPLINARTYMTFGDNSSIDINHNGNNIVYRDFKLAIREIRLIEAIESKYGITFSRDFFDRSIFYNKFLWCHKEAGQMRTSSDSELVNFTTKTAEIATGSGWGSVAYPYDFATDEIFVRWQGFPSVVNNPFYGTVNKRIKINLKITTSSNNNYRVELYDNDVLSEEFTDLNGTTTVTLYNKTIQEDNQDHNFTVKISAIEGNITFSTASEINYISSLSGYDRTIIITSPSQTTTNAVVKIREQLPDIKVKEYFISLINQFNLIIRPISVDEYYIDTLDNWYNKGKAYDISGLVDIENIEVKKPSVKKKIDFLYQKTDTILGKQYFENNQQSYGDLKAVYNIQGDELKIESQFENLLFTRFVDSGTSVVTDLQGGFAVDKNNNPVKGKAISFYRNGVESSDNIHINGTSLIPIWHTATEDNYTFEQVTNSLNFGADNSSYFYAPIDTGLYHNFWRTYIEDLYNLKTRVLNLKCKLPVRILQSLELNDKFIIGDYKYKISSIKVDITNGDAELEVFSDLSTPIDSVDNIIPLTADTTEYTADTILLTADMVSIYDPVTSYTINGISLTEYNATKGEEHFELRIFANTNWTITEALSWVSVNKTTGNKSDYVRISINKNTSTARSGTITITIGATDYTLTINQL
jgi:hypothetical protein